MKLIVLENFRVWAEQPGAASRRVDYTKGMVVDGLPDEVADDWVAKGLAQEIPEPPKEEREAKGAKAS